MDIDINPSFAWKPNDFFSVGGGISLQYAKAKLGLDATLGNLYLGHGEETGDSWGWGWNLGFVLRPTDNFRFGILIVPQLSIKPPVILKYLMQVALT